LVIWCCDLFGICHLGLEIYKNYLSAVIIKEWGCFARQKRLLTPGRKGKTEKFGHRLAQRLQRKKARK
jgi:hypothetical protein